MRESSVHQLASGHPIRSLNQSFGKGQTPENKAYDKTVQIVFQTLPWLFLATGHGPRYFYFRATGSWRWSQLIWGKRQTLDWLPAKHKAILHPHLAIELELNLSCLHQSHVSVSPYLQWLYLHVFYGKMWTKQIWVRSVSQEIQPAYSVALITSQCAVSWL